MAPVVSMVGPKTPNVAKESVETNQNIQVFVRCRPLKPNERKSVVDVVNDRKEVRINERGGGALTAKTFTFDNTFSGDAKQIDVYLSVVEPLIEQVMMGYNCTVFAYGQTGTGKTYTMEGERSSDELSWESDPECGIIPRALHQLFSRLESQLNEHTVRVSFLELYNEELYDLLSAIDDTTKLKIYEDTTRKGSTIVGGLEEITVNTKAEIYDILRKGSAKRQTASTLLNACSSRSHTIFSVTVHIKESSIDGEDMVKIGKLNLVDLAGSENIGRSGAIDKRAREAGNINQSLLTLGRVITCLVEKTPHVPYRESKLTRLLQDSLGGRTKTSIIATISPNCLDVEDSLSTLEYAQRAKKITNKPEVNQKMSKKTLLREYTAEIDRLRRDLAACREKNGIYINEENYNEMQERIKIQNEDIESKLAHINAITEEVTKIQSLFEATKEELEVKSNELEKTSHTLRLTSNQLIDTKNSLCLTKVERDEQKHLVDKHVDCEKVLLSQAKQLLSVADNTTSDAHKLHNKIDRQKNIETQNQSKINEFKRKIADDMKRMEELVCVTTSTYNDNADDLQKIVMNKLNELNEQVFGVYKSANYLSNLAKDPSIFEHSISLKDEYKALFTEMMASFECYLNKFDGTQLTLEKEMQSIVEIVAQQRTVIEQLTMEQNSCLAANKQLVENSFKEIKTEIKLMSDNNAKELNEFGTDLVNIIEEHRQSQLSISEKFKKYHEIIVQSSIIMKDIEAEQNRKDAEIDKVFTAIVDKINLAKIWVKKSSDEMIADIDKYQKSIAAEEELAFGCNEKADNLNTENTQQIINRCNEIKSSAKEKLNETKSTLASNKTAITAQTDRCVKSNEAIVELIGNQTSEELSTVSNMCEELNSISENVGNASENVSEKVAEINRTASTMKKSLIREIVNRKNEIERFLKSDIIVDTPTGVTPQKTTFDYPRTLAQTSPHDRILQKYRALMEPIDASNAPLPDESDDSEFYSDSHSSSRANSSSSLSSVNNENIPINRSKSSIDVSVKFKSGPQTKTKKQKNIAKFDKIVSNEVKSENKKPQLIPLKAKINN